MFFLNDSGGCYAQNLKMCYNYIKTSGKTLDCACLPSHPLNSIQIVDERGRS